MNAGDAAGGIGDGGEQARPALAGRVDVGPAPERWVRAQRRPVETPGYAAHAEETLRWLSRGT